jgi:YlmC/YmxH family sporulation protein
VVTLELSRLARKEIINLYDGARLGYVGESDLLIDEQSGQIKAIIITPRGLPLRFGRSRELIIPWVAVKRVGKETMIIDLSPTRQPFHYKDNE